MQEFYFMKNFEKIKRDIFKGVINSQIFAILIAAIISFAWMRFYFKKFNIVRN